MPKRKSRKRKKITLRQKLKDERFIKLMGSFCLLIAFYLFIAFSSYLFTWQTDQDQVLRFSWNLLFESDVEMANWLGRLGAIISNLFFYWLYGLPSFLIVLMLLLLGGKLINNRPVSTTWSRIGTLVLIMLFVSVVLEFSFVNAKFAWGGAFGEVVADWLSNFLGTAGVIALFLFIVAAFVIWIFNPKPGEFTFSFINLKSPFKKISFNNISENEEKEDIDDAEGLRPTFAEDYQKKQKKSTVSKLLLFDLDLKKPEKQKPNPQHELGLEIKAPNIDPDTSIESSVSDPPGDEELSMIIQEENTLHSEPYDPKAALSKFEQPTLNLLENYDDMKVEIDRQELERNKDQIIETLLNYKIEIIKIRATIGPTVTLYEIVPAPGVRISKIKNLEDDIALSLSALGIRIIAPIPGKGTIGIEVPNKNKQIVSLKEVLKSDKYQNAKFDLPIAIGKTISNEVFVADLAKMPHLLVAGATGQGKSVGINSIICSLIYKKHPSQIKFVLIDPKKVELFPYGKLENYYLAYLPGLDEPIVTDTTKVVHTLNSLIIEMEERYNLLKKAEARNIREYNEKFVKRKLNPNKGHRFFPFIVLVIDEFADLIMTAGKEIELPIGRLAQLSRAVGIHLIIATQRPSVNIITGVIKANFPARIAFKVTAKVDSRTIIDTGGADRLIGRGDMLLSYGSDLIRLQCAFVDTPEIERIIDFISSQHGYPEPYYLPEYHGDDVLINGEGIKVSDLDEMFETAARLIVQNQIGSTSMIQRKLRLGYNRAGRIMDQLEAVGIVGASEGSKAREVLIYDEVELMRHLDQLKSQN